MWAVTSSPGTSGGATSWTYQSTGWCQDHCIASASPAFALAAGQNCLCANYLPDPSTKVDESKCNDPCTGWPEDMCGGIGYYSIYKTGLDNSVSTAPDPSSSSSSNSTAEAPNNTTTSVSSTGTNSEATVIVTATSDPGAASAAAAAASSAEAAERQKDSNAHTTASIAAGVVVGVVGLCALAGAAFFFYRSRKQKSGAYQRSHMPEMTDARFDGAYITNRRPSEDSIDYPDFSSQVLQVTNPDRHY
ncbi:hypothetical protein N7470_000280 [Penicillium chermesinum]|nr:hypothetical protein N7470_000280 [Penicillium chermesinum]